MHKLNILLIIHLTFILGSEQVVNDVSSIDEITFSEDDLRKPLMTRWHWILYDKEVFEYVTAVKNIRVFIEFLFKK